MKNLNNSKEKEIWKEIEGFDGQYIVSNKGNVKNKKTNRLLGGGYNQHGYRYVILKGKHYTVHRLTALAFIPNPNKLPQVDHIDENKRNNYVSNLRWVSKSENIRHSAHQKSCRINQLTLDGEFVKIWESSWQIERETGYRQGNIIQCCKRKRKQAYGYRWEYSDTSQQRKFNRPVAALTKDGEFVAKYKSIAEASRCLKIKYICIYLCLNGKTKSTHGLKFIYID